MFLIDDIAAAAGAGKIGTMLVSTAIVAAVGFAGAEVYEHRAPWGLEAQRDSIRDGIPAKLESARRQARLDQVREDSKIVEQWSGKLASCQRERDTQAQDAGRQLDAARRASVGSREAAYQLGRASCRGDESAQRHPTDGGTGGSAPVLMLDGDVELRSVLAGAAYAPGHP